MRRFTDDEMAALIRLCRDGRQGPARAMDAMWELILQDAEGVGVVEAAARTPQFRVQDYAISADQAQQLHDATVLRRRLPDRVARGFAMMWFAQSPADYDAPTV